MSDGPSGKTLIVVALIGAAGTIGAAVVAVSLGSRDDVTESVASVNQASAMIDEGSSPAAPSNRATSTSVISGLASRSGDEVGGVDSETAQFVRDLAAHPDIPQDLRNFLEIVDRGRLDILASAACATSDAGFDQYLAELTPAETAALSDYSTKFLEGTLLVFYCPDNDRAPKVSLE